MHFLFSHSTTIRKNDWMVITFEETPTNIWELVLLFFFVGCFFFTNSYTSILKLISSINFSVESEGLDLTVEHVYIYVYIYILFIYIYMYIYTYWYIVVKLFFV